MFTKKSPQPKSGLETTIDNLIAEMAVLNADSEEYAAMVDQLVKLYALKELDAPKRISPDTMAIVAANLLGIVLIVGHERTNVLTSKALNFVLKLR